MLIIVLRYEAFIIASYQTGDIPTKIQFLKVSVIANPNC